MINLLHIFLALVLTSAPLLAQNPADTPREIAGHRTIHGAQVSARPMPIPTRYVFDEKRDWVKQPFRLAVVLIEFSDKKHTDIHSAAFYDGVLFSRDQYHRQPDGKVSFGSLADWYRTVSQGRFVLMGKVFDWVSNDETFEAVHTMTFKDARERDLKAALAKVRARDGATVLDEFDGYYFIHAGPITGPTGMLFSHMAEVAGRRYCTTGEIERIGVFCHEFGHMLGLPDLYGKAGVRESFGPWCTMGAGYRGLYPKSFCAWSKTRLGWCHPTVVDAASPQKLVLRPIQTHPDDAFIIPLNAKDGAGGEFLLLENRNTASNDEEGQQGLFIWRIRCKAADSGKLIFELTLPGPADAPGADQNKRRVAWPFEKARDFVVAPDADTLPAAIHDIRLEGDLIHFDLGSK